MDIIQAVSTHQFLGLLIFRCVFGITTIVYDEGQTYKILLATWKG
jgi:hypothetical protein